MEFKCLKATEPLWGEFTFYHSVPRGPGNHLIDFNWMKGWNDLVTLKPPSTFESGILYYESSIFTTRISVKARPILNVNVQLSQTLNKLCILR